MRCRGPRRPHGRSAGRRGGGLRGAGWAGGGRRSRRPTATHRRWRRANPPPRREQTAPHRRPPRPRAHRPGPSPCGPTATTRATRATPGPAPTRRRTRCSPQGLGIGEGWEQNDTVGRRVYGTDHTTRTPAHARHASTGNCPAGPPTASCSTSRTGHPRACPPDRGRWVSTSGASGALQPTHFAVSAQGVRESSPAGGRTGSPPHAVRVRTSLPSTTTADTSSSAAAASGRSRGLHGRRTGRAPRLPVERTAPRPARPGGLHRRGRR